MIHNALTGRLQSSYKYLQFRIMTQVFSKKMLISKKKPVYQIVFKFLMPVLFICFEYLNLRYVLIKFFKLTTEHVESNPGP